MCIESPSRQEACACARLAAAINDVLAKKEDELLLGSQPLDVETHPATLYPYRIDSMGLSRGSLHYLEVITGKIWKRSPATAQNGHVSAYEELDPATRPYKEVCDLIARLKIILMKK